MARSLGVLSDDGKTITVTVGATLLDDPLTGAWCPSCSLPSAIQGTAVLEVAGTPHVLLRVTACTDCEWRHTEPA